MGLYRAEAFLPLEPSDVFDLWMDPVRAPQWQEMLERVYDATGDVDVPGVTFRQDFGPRLKRTVTVLTSRRPEVYRTRSVGAGWKDETTVRFEPAGNGTRLVCDVELELGWGVIGRLYQWRLGRAGIERKLRQELDRFVAFATRPRVDARPGQLMTVDCGAGFRFVQVLEVERDNVHVCVFAGATKKRSSEPEQLLATGPSTPDPVAFHPLSPPISSVTRLVTVGQPLLALDGGHGLPHLALTRGAFVDAIPKAVGDVPVSPEMTEEVAAWRQAGGPLGGRDLRFDVVPLVRWASDTGFGVAKILKRDTWAVHVRLYSNRWPEPPLNVNPWLLRVDPPWAETPGIAHLPLSVPAYFAWGAQFVRLTMVGQAELAEYDEWKRAGGRALGLRDIAEMGADIVEDPTKPTRG